MRYRRHGPPLTTFDEFVHRDAGHSTGLLKVLRPFDGGVQDQGVASVQAERVSPQSVKINRT
jgi:hypothetical protein